jgi:hypothetical protein
LVAGGDVTTDFKIADSGLFMAYRADQDTDGVVELYGSFTNPNFEFNPKLNGDLVTDGNVSRFEFVPGLINTDARVVYLADQDTLDTKELYSRRLLSTDTGEVKLNGPVTIGARDFKISPDGQTVVHEADPDTFGVFGLYSGSTFGGSTVRLNETLVSGGGLAGFEITADSKRVVYKADQESTSVFELYTVPITGGTVTRVNDPLPLSADVEDFLISSDSKYIVYRADQDVADELELFSVEIITADEVLCVPIKAANGNIASVCL